MTNHHNRARKLRLYPLFELFDANGKQRVRCVDHDTARQYKANHGWTIRLEQRDLAYEATFPNSRRAEIAAIYARGV